MNPRMHPLFEHRVVSLEVGLILAPSLIISAGESTLILGFLSHTLTPCIIYLVLGHRSRPNSVQTTTQTLVGHLPVRNTLVSVLLRRSGWGWPMARLRKFLHSRSPPPLNTHLNPT